MARATAVKLVIGDIVVIVAVLLVALALALFPWIGRKEASYARIAWAEESVLLPLAEDTSYEVTSAGYTLTVTIEDGRVSVLHSTCPDRVCVNSGTISRGGEVIICAPAMVTVEILSESEEVDYVIG